MERFEYQWNTATTEPPGNNQVRLDNADPSLATKLWVREQTAGGEDVTRLLEAVPVGSRLYIQDIDDHDHAIMYTLASAAIVKTDYIELPLTFVNSVGALANARVMLLIAEPLPAAPPEPPPGAVASWQPTLAQVVAYIPTRPKDAFGNYQPVFNDNTVPTDEQAEDVIAAATAHLGARLGSLDDLCEDQLNTRAGGLAALYAAMLIELGYYPEQVAKGNSPYPMLRELWGEELDSFLAVVQSECGEVPGGGGDNGDLPADVPPAAWDFYKPVTDLGFESVW